MNDDGDEKKHECPAGIPAWMATFADLMSLLMCFFVLLLSFSQMDAMEFKRLAGSMRQAFGVQALVEANQIPKGTSIIAQEFSPGKPEPTPLQMVMQQTSADLPNLEQVCEQVVEQALAEQCPDKPSSEISDIVVEQMKSLSEQAESDAVDLATVLEEQVRMNQVEIEARGRRIIIRVQERGSFSSGRADLSPEFYPVVENMVSVLRNTLGKISVEGHTDNVPINTPRFRSNWELSVARALEVAHALFDSGELAQDRFTIKGFGDTMPLVPNDSRENRARNRRVEIIVQAPLDSETLDNIEKIRQTAPPILNRREQLEIQGLKPDEIF